jgi:hypothetical protein
MVAALACDDSVLALSTAATTALKLPFKDKNTWRCIFYWKCNAFSTNLMHGAFSRLIYLQKGTKYGEKESYRC